MNKIKTTRHCADFYSVTDGTNEVEITYHDHLDGWVARALWDMHLYSDPEWTLREAKQAAISMIESWGMAE